MFRTRVTVQFYQADPAGILFYGQVFSLVHMAYEEFIRELPVAFDEWFANPDWNVPVVKTEAEFRRPLLAGQRVDVTIGVERVGSTSYGYRAELERDGETHATVRTTHVFVDSRSGRARRIPEEIRSRLQRHLTEG